MSIDMSSIRARLNVYLVLIIAPILLIGGVALSLVITAAMEREFDWALEATARSLVALTELDEGEIEFDYVADVMPEFARQDDPHFYEIRSDGERPLFRSKTFEFMSSAPVERTFGGPAADSDEPQFQDIVLPDGRDGRQLTIVFSPQVDDGEEEEPPAGREAPEEHKEAVPPVETPSLTLVVAREREALDRRFLMLYLAFLFAGLAVLAAFAILILFLLRAAFRPLDSLKDQVRSLEVQTRLERIDVPGMPTEIAPVVTQINGLLGRIETALERERQLTSNIGHELKTPVAELRNLCEVGGRWPSDPAIVQQFFADALAISEQMDRIVSNLLMLARYEAGKGNLSEEPVDLNDMLTANWQLAAQTADRRGVTLTRQVPPGLVLKTDPEILSLILSNLLINAATYASPQTEVSCAADRRDGTLRLRIANRAENLVHEDLDKMFDRFWRKDIARTGGQHLGLGLALVQAFSSLLEFEIDAALDDTGMFSVSLTTSRAVD